MKFPSMTPEVAGCDCLSYNLSGPQEGTAEVALDPPQWLQDMRDHDRPNRSVMVDACIASAVQAVWDAGFVTLGSCCGHAGRVADRPSLVLGEGERDYDDVRSLLAQVDGRRWRLLQWQLVEVPSNGSRKRPADPGGSGSRLEGGDE